MALLLTHAAQLLTLAGPPGARRGPAMAELGLIADGAVLTEGGRILRAGPTDMVARHLPAGIGPVEEIDCRGQLLAPGLIDAHTHLVFAGSRLDDYERRLRGESYAQIAAAGGGIQLSVQGLRAASEGTLFEGALKWLRAAQACGSTTVEVKTGYGLELEAERKTLRVAAALAARSGIDLPRTFLGAHIVPREYAARRGEYLRLLIETMLPAALALPDAAPEFVDVFCDPAGFDPDESRQVLEAARARGAGLKLHAEQFARTGGVALGVELGAVSVDHLDAVDRSDARLLAGALTVATLLPGANFFLGQAYPPARMLIEAGAAVALATDFNPGTCPIVSLPLIMSLACSGMRLSPAEAWTAVTINAAAALSRAHLAGSIEPGKRADLAIFDTGDYRAVPYYAGQNLCRAVVQAGSLVRFGG